MKKDLTPFSDILIVCGQGTYEKGNYYIEYPDRDVYLRQALNVGQIVKQFKYTHIVCSGGFTQSRSSALSEAKSFLDMWEDTDSWPMNQSNIYLDELSLDSAENIYLGLMAARVELDEVPIRRIGVFAAWKFKKVRFNSLARELGITDRFYFHGLAWANEADAGECALQGESDQMKKIADTDDHLLLSDEWEQKRRCRYCGQEEYENRLNKHRKQFPKFFNVLDDIGLHGMRDALRKRLQEAFRNEVVKPFA